VKWRNECALRGAIQDAIDRGAAIGGGSEGSNRVACLEGEGFLDAVNWTEVVVFYFAQLEEAKRKKRC
jgi:hypothetical protein